LGHDALNTSKIYSKFILCQKKKHKVEAPVVDHLNNFRADGEEYEVMENFAM